MNCVLQYVQVVPMNNLGDGFVNECNLEGSDPKSHAGKSDFRLDETQGGVLVQRD